jgi:hypothetical protein
VDYVTSTAVTISWVKPDSDGGCDLIGYSIYTDDANGNFDEYDAVNVRNKPLLSSYIIDMSSKSVG